MARISVILPCHNGGHTIDEALQSLVSQTYRDLEILVRDDGSDDDSSRIIRQHAEKDSRIKLSSSPKSGIVASMNSLIDEASGEFIARMDADDIAHPTRLERQLDLMVSNPRVAVAGSWVRTFGYRHETWHCSPYDNKIKNQLMLGVTPLCHPTWLVRAETYQATRYDKAYEYIEDREWLTRVFYTYPSLEFSAVPEMLLHYRTHDKSITANHAALQKQKTEGIVRTLLLKLGVVLPDELMDFHLFLCGLHDRAPAAGLFFKNMSALHASLQNRLQDEHKIVALRALECARRLKLDTNDIENMRIELGVSDFWKK
jgi:glycosyltransferase involved in cell wall biosynthesis